MCRFFFALTNWHCPAVKIKNPFRLAEQVYYTVFKYNSPGFIKAMRLMFHAHRLAGENQSYIKTT